MSFVAVNGIDVHHEITGSGEPLVLVHGWGADGTMYEEQRELSKRFTLLLYDQRGHGRTSKSPDDSLYTIKQFAEDLRALLDALGWEKVFLAGHSMGGSVALRFALDHPEYVRKLVLASTFAKRRLALGERLQLSLARLVPMRLIAVPFAKSCMAKPDPDLVRRIVAFYERAGKNTLLRAARSIGEVDFTDELGNVRAETLVLHGDRDDKVPFENCEALHRGIPGSTLTILRECGHSVNWEKPGEFNAALGEFFSRK